MGDDDDGFQVATESDDAAVDPQNSRPTHADAGATDGGEVDGERWSDGKDGGADATDDDVKLSILGQNARGMDGEWETRE